MPSIYMGWRVCVWWLCVCETLCYLTWHDYPSLVEGESHCILLYFQCLWLMTVCFILNLVCVQPPLRLNDFYPTYLWTCKSFFVTHSNRLERRGLAVEVAEAGVGSVVCVAWEVVEDGVDVVVVPWGGGGNPIHHVMVMTATDPVHTTGLLMTDGRCHHTQLTGDLYHKLTLLRKYYPLLPSQRGSVWIMGKLGYWFTASGSSKAEVGRPELLVRP